jgi:hypothetical protein
MSIVRTIFSHSSSGHLFRDMRYVTYGEQGPSLIPLARNLANCITQISIPVPAAGFSGSFAGWANSGHPEISERTRNRNECGSL